MLDNKVMKMSPGEALLDVPMGEMIQKLAVAIAEAQLRLDQVGVRVASLLSEAKVDFKKEDGTTTTKSLLELGFMPTFYHFTETEIEVKLTLSMKVTEALDIGGSASVGDTGATGTATGDGTTPPAGDGTGTAAKGESNRLVPWGAAINAEYHRKYEFEMTGASTVKTKLVAIPAPSVFIDTIKEHARAGGTIG
jgi:hypothetical protein